MTISKFYFHDATTSDTGTLPGSTISVFDGTTLLTSQYGVVATGAGTNRAMDETIGSGQTSIALTTLAQTAQQNNIFRRYCTPPLAAQVISSSFDYTLSLAGSESNGASNLLFDIILSQWRPSTGALVRNWANGGGTLTTEPGTSQTAVSGTAPGGVGPQTLADGDILVLELFGGNAQSMAIAYTNTAFYDGTTEASSSNCASFLSFSVAFTLYVPSAFIAARPHIVPSYAVQRASYY